MKNHVRLRSPVENQRPASATMTAGRLTRRRFMCRDTYRQLLSFSDSSSIRLSCRCSTESLMHAVATRSDAQNKQIAKMGTL